MNVKEKPLMNATSKTGPLPMFSNPFMAGVAAALVMTGMGAFLTLFHSFTFSQATALPMYELARGGAYVGIILAGLSTTVALVSMPREPEEQRIRLLFCAGAVVGIVIAVVFDALTVEYFREQLSGRGHMQ